MLIKYKGDDLSNLVINLENQKMFEDLCFSERHLFCLIGFFEFNEVKNKLWFYDPDFLLLEKFKSIQKIYGSLSKNQKAISSNQLPYFMG